MHDIGCIKDVLKYASGIAQILFFLTVLGPKSMFAERDKQYPRKSGQTGLDTAVTNITKPVTKINFGPST